MYNFVVFGKPDCPFCKDVIAFLEANQDKYSYRYVDISDKGDMQLAFKAAYKTVPQIFLDTEHDFVHIGDSTEFTNYILDLG